MPGYQAPEVLRAKLDGCDGTHAQVVAAYASNMLSIGGIRLSLLGNKLIPSQSNRMRF